MTRIVVPLVILGAIAIASPAFADDSRPFFRQFLVMWLPLLAIIGVWVYFIRQMKTSKQAQAIERSIPHMDALEQKLDRIIELLERQVNR